MDISHMVVTRANMNKRSALQAARTLRRCAHALQAHANCEVQATTKLRTNGHEVMLQSVHALQPRP